MKFQNFAHVEINADSLLPEHSWNCHAWATNSIVAWKHLFPFPKLSHLSSIMTLTFPNLTFSWYLHKMRRLLCGIVVAQRLCAMDWSNRSWRRKNRTKCSAFACMTDRARKKKSEHAFRMASVDRDFASSSWSNPIWSIRLNRLPFQKQQHAASHCVFEVTPFQTSTMDPGSAILKKTNPAELAQVKIHASCVFFHSRFA